MVRPRTAQTPNTAILTSSTTVARHTNMPRYPETMILNMTTVAGRTPKINIPTCTMLGVTGTTPPR